MIASKLKFSIVNTFNNDEVLKFIFNKEYGLRIINGEDDKYFDIDLQLGTLTSKIYITTCKQKIYISVNGLHYSDIIY